MKKYINLDLLKIIISTFFFLIALFLPNNLQIIFLVISYLVISFEMYLETLKSILKGEIFDENFLMIIATIGAFFIGNYVEAILVILLFQIGEYFSHLAVHKSKESITNLIDLRVEKVTLIKNGKQEEIKAENIKVGDIILVKPGEKIPVDGDIIEGTSYLDTTSLTGEAIPKKVTEDDFVLSGSVNKESVLKVKATTTYEKSTASKILELLEKSNSTKSKTETFIRKFAKIYTPVIVFIAIFIVIIPTIFGADFNEWLYKALSFLVTACPCALVISVPLGYFCGIGSASRNGILVKGSKELDALTNIDYLMLDKTGTITEGVFEVTEINTEMNEKEFINILASVEENSIHPIAEAIKKENQLPLRKITSYKEIAGKGITCKMDNKNVLVGNDKLLDDNAIKYPKEQSIGTVIYLVIDNKLLGNLIISDKIKQSSLRLSELNNYINKEIIILSGDNNEVVKTVSKKVGIKKYYGELLPLAKVDYVEKYQKKGKVMFIGDGINDAPVIKLSDVGVSMGKLGSDAAIEASDIVLIHDDILKIKTAIKIAKKTKRKVTESIIFALIVKFLILTLSLLGLSTMLMAVFADVGVTFLVILNVLLIFNNKSYS